MIKKSCGRLNRRTISAITIGLALVAYGKSQAITVPLSFGSNGFGQTGLGTDMGSTLVAAPINLGNLAGRQVIQVDASVSGDTGHSIILTSDGTVFTFGRNSDGRTGLGLTSGETLIPTPIITTNLGGKSIKQVVAGGSSSLLLATDGTVYSMGSPGQIGINGSSVVSVATPIDTSNLSGKKIAQIAAGTDHSLLLSQDGEVFSMGYNDSGRTGLGTDIGNAYIATPIDTTNLDGKKISRIAAGGLHSLLLADDGTVFSFGWNGFGATGLGTTVGETLVATPINPSNLGGKRIVDIAAGGGNSLLLASDGTVFSFGDNLFGATGLGIDSGRTTIATQINTTNLLGQLIAHMDVGAGHTLLLSQSGTVFSFGLNSLGRTGLGTTSGSTLIATPIDTSNFSGLPVTYVSAGFNHSLMIAVPEPSGISLLIVCAVSLSILVNRAGR